MEKTLVGDEVRRPLSYVGEYETDPAGDVGVVGVVVDGAVVVVAAFTTTVTLSVAFCPVVSVTVSVAVYVPVVVYVFVAVLPVASEVMPFDASKSQE